MYDRILVPLDGSETAAFGLREALRMAHLCQSTVVLLHVVELHPMMTEVATAAMWEQLSQAQHDHGRRLLEAQRQAVLDAGVQAEVHLMEATPGARVCDAILAAVRAQRAQLIVMGTHGRRGALRALLGSDAELVARASPVPVLLVRGA